MGCVYRAVAWQRVDQIRYNMNIRKFGGMKSPYKTSHYKERSSQNKYEMLSRRKRHSTETSTDRSQKIQGPQVFSGPHVRKR
jgi:hypothetical protein